MKLTTDEKTSKLVSTFPWLSDDFAETLAKKLTGDEVRQLLTECDKGYRSKLELFLRHVEEQPTQKAKLAVLSAELERLQQE